MVLYINLNLQMEASVKREFAKKPTTVRVSLQRPESETSASNRQKTMTYAMDIKEQFSLADYQKVKNAGFFPVCSLQNTYHGLVLKDLNKREFALCLLDAGDTDFPAAVGLELLAGDYLSSSDIDSAQPNILLEASVARQLFGDYKEALGQMVMVNTSQLWHQVPGFTEESLYTVVGVFTDSFDPRFTDSFNRHLAVIPYTCLPGDRQQVSGQPFVVHLPVGTDIVEAQGVLEDLFPGREGYFNLTPIGFSFEDHLANVRSSTFLWGVFAFVALLVSSISIFSITTVNIVEKSREMGLQRALGRTKLGTIGHTLFVSILYVLPGWLIGLIFGYYAQLLIFTGTRAFIFLPYPMDPHLLKTTIYISLAISLVTGIIFGIYPAWQAAKMAPVDLLKDD